ncbi:MAG: membrane protein insertion efficiency factor YidD [Thermoguttaceae bacterium]|nr:membrane protein insertion efficiency factor YidD [Thermoguttaceae bacterium]
MANRQIARGAAGFRLLLALIGGLPAKVLIGLVRVYQYTISPLIGQRCRFYPSCSNYFIEAIRKYGALRGSIRGIWRILRCNPWSPGGIDPP